MSGKICHFFPDTCWATTCSLRTVRPSVQRYAVTSALAVRRSLQISHCHSGTRSSSRSSKQHVSGVVRRLECTRSSSGRGARATARALLFLAACMCLFRAFPSHWNRLAHVLLVCGLCSRESARMLVWSMMLMMW